MKDLPDAEGAVLIVFSKEGLGEARFAGATTPRKLLNSAIFLLSQGLAIARKTEMRTEMAWLTKAVTKRIKKKRWFR